ncbi:DUF4145 domain-containing protein [Aquimarina sp. MMG016]|uniref:DUF4145 domain-containing protein n=1 Tax=Aquimarina sp. MMG016 TaxID=2822690 RepID=UPI001B39E3F0|nr:DUF4145 domain-containing protein [Aquimarina sp. MMG016]MBQ4818617.1 DUF4145 domain-containing protein [Aquimarina sp. MMG016]
MVTSKKEKLKVYCATCKVDTIHGVLKEVEDNGEAPMSYYPEDLYWWNSMYQIIQCLGCERISFREENYNSEDVDENGAILNESLYPSRDFDSIINKDFYAAPYSVRQIYYETIECYNGNLLILCAAGTRALVENICKSNDIVKGTVYWEEDGVKKSKVSNSLGGKINGLFEKGIISKNNSDALHEHKFLGDKAIHELKTPSKKDLKIAIEIIETIIESIYEIPKKTRKLKRNREI